MRSIITSVAVAAWALLPIGPAPAASLTEPAPPTAAPAAITLSLLPGFLPNASGAGIAAERRLDLAIQGGIQATLQASFQASVTDSAGSHYLGRIGLRFEF